MALRLVTSHATTLNTLNLLKTVRVCPLKTYSTLLNSQRRAVAKPLNLMVKNRNFNARSITLSAPRLMTAGENHTTLWTLERVISLALLGVIPAAFIAPSQTLDTIMAISLVLHSHWGIEAMVTDYVRPSVVGNIVPKVAHVSLLIISMASLGGLFYLIYNDIGIAKSIKKLWSVKAA